MASPYNQYLMDMKRFQPRFTTDAPVQYVRPELPNNFDAAQRDSQGIPTVTPAQYQENNRRMYSLQPIPQQPRSTWQTPTRDDALNIGSRYGGYQGFSDTAGNLQQTGNTFQRHQQMAATRSQPNGSVAPTTANPNLGSSPSRAAMMGQPRRQPAWFQDAIAGATQRTAAMGSQAQAEGTPSGISPPTQRFYDRKFNRQSRDPYTRMNARRIGNAPQEDTWTPY